MIVTLVLMSAALSAAPPSFTFSTSGGLGLRDVLVDGAGDIYVVSQGVDREQPLGANVPHHRMGNPGGGDVWILKLDRELKPLWTCVIGGNTADDPRAAALDAAGNLYVVGTTNGGTGAAGNFPTTPNGYRPHFQLGSPEAFALKLDPSGSKLLWSTFLGGNGHDEPRDVAVDGQGAVVIGGRTYSTDFAATPNALTRKKPGELPAGFLIKLNADGSRALYASLVTPSAMSEVQGVAVDAAGDIIVAGQTDSAALPVTRCAPQTARLMAPSSYVMKLSGRDYRVLYATYLGERMGLNFGGLAVDAKSNAVLAVSARSREVYNERPIKWAAPAFQRSPMSDLTGMVLKLNPEGSAFSAGTYLGGGGGTSPRALALDAAGNLFVGGLTESADFPLTPDAVKSKLSAPGLDIFLARLDPNGERLTYSTYLGGSGDERSLAIAVDAEGAPVLAVTSSAPDFVPTPTATAKLPADLARLIVLKLPVSRAPPARPREVASVASADGGCPGQTPRLRVAMSGKYMPMHGVDSGGGFIGFEAELAAALAQALGVQLHFLTAEERSRTTIDTVADGKADVAISAITPSPERAKKVDFTRPYITLKVRVATRTDASASAPASWAGSKIALVDGPWTAEVQARLRGAQVKIVTSPAAALMLLDERAVDYAVGEDVGLIDAAGNASLRFLPEPLADSPIAIATPKGQAKRYDAALAKLSIGALAAKWKVGVPRPPPENDGDLFVSFCHSGGIEVVALVNAAGGVTMFGDTPPSFPPMTEEQSAAADAAVWYALVDGKARLMRSGKCPERTFAVSQPAEVRSPPNQQGAWLRTDDGTLVQLDEYRDVQLCSYTDSPGQYECGESGHRLSVFRNGELKQEHRQLDKWGD